ncbi:hypothetical protein LCGC14_1925620 [marine sediment metagenome]|uniref:Uncharacterized protein n=1 Tax=marine sediment metagenome TaxID=412755 RepID=A0A0F9GCY1_9ZZZZ
MQRYSAELEHEVIINGETFILKSFPLFKRRNLLGELSQIQRDCKRFNTTAEDFNKLCNKTAEFIIKIKGYKGTPLQFLKEEIVYNNDLVQIINCVSLHGILTEEQLKNLHSLSVSATEEPVGSVTKDAPSEQELVSEETPVEN